MTLSEFEPAILRLLHSASTNYAIACSERNALQKLKKRDQLGDLEVSLEGKILLKRILKEA
jgi:hypothetical protein